MHGNSPYTSVSILETGFKSLNFGQFSNYNNENEILQNECFGRVVVNLHHRSYSHSCIEKVTLEERCSNSISNKSKGS